MTIRAELAKHVKKITLKPEGRTYVAADTWDLLGVAAWMVPKGGKWTERLPVQFEWLAARKFSESAVIAASFSKIGGKGSEVEADETFVGGVARFMHARLSQADDY